MELTETALIAERDSAFMSADQKTPAHLVEAAANVVGGAVLLSAGNGNVGGDVLAVDQDPGDWAARPALIVFACALLGVVQPVLESPEVRLFLYGLPSGFMNGCRLEITKGVPLLRSSCARCRRSSQRRWRQYRQEGHLRSVGRT